MHVLNYKTLLKKTENDLIERCLMFNSKKTILLRCQYYQTNLQIRSNPYQNPNTYFLQKQKVNFNIDMEMRGAKSS